MNMLITVFLMLLAFINQGKSILKGTPVDLRHAGTGVLQTSPRNIPPLSFHSSLSPFTFQ